MLFDEEKAARNNYNIADLYDDVGKSIERLGMERLARGTWHVRRGYDEVEAQCLALSVLSRIRWVIKLYNN